MAELPGHHVETGTGSKREHGVAVPGAVKGDRRDAGRCYQSAPPAEQRVGVNHGSVRLGDHPRKDDSKPAVGAPGRPARRDASDKAEQFSLESRRIGGARIGSVWQPSCAAPRSTPANA
jgi:hypothetical protein